MGEVPRPEGRLVGRVWRVGLVGAIAGRVLRIFLDVDFGDPSATVRFRANHRIEDCENMSSQAFAGRIRENVGLEEMAGALE